MVTNSRGNRKRAERDAKIRKGLNDDAENALIEGHRVAHGRLSENADAIRETLSFLAAQGMIIKGGEGQKFVYADMEGKKFTRVQYGCFTTTRNTLRNLNSTFSIRDKKKGWQSELVEMQCEIEEFKALCEQYGIAFDADKKAGDSEKDAPRHTPSKPPRAR